MACFPLARTLLLIVRGDQIRIISTKHFPPLGGPYLHQLHVHGHADGEEHIDGVRLPQDQGVLQGEARSGVPGGRHAVGRQGRDDRRAHDHGERQGK